MTIKLGVQCSIFATAYQIIAINVDEFDQICKWLLGFKVSLRGMKVPFTSNYETMLYSKFILKQKKYPSNHCNFMGRDLLRTYFQPAYLL